MRKHRAYYNEIDSYCCAWLSNLMDAELIAPGTIDDRSIVDVRPDDLTGYSRAHFFSGIAGWDLALRWAGWSEDRPVWTGSCPCQPLSSAGLQKGHADERHLWPAFHALIDQCRPATVFGEQVASKDGREWFAAVRADLEALGYACGGADLPAAGAGAPHRRPRIWWVADAGSDRRIRREVVSKEHRTTMEQREEAEWGEDIVCSEIRLANGTIPVGGWYPDPELVTHVDGVPDQLGQIRAYGNAIVPQVAAEFIAAFMECRP